MLWIAPLPGSGCAVFKATVIEHRDMWYMDDGPLTKEFCEDEQSYDDLLPLTLETCSACSEAKYEVRFKQEKGKELQLKLILNWVFL